MGRHFEKKLSAFEAAWQSGRRATFTTALIGSLLAAEGGVAFATEANAVETALVTQDVISDENPYLVGAGAADMTGEPGEVGMMGYGDSSQKSSGVLTRQYARAFVIEDPATGQRNLMVVLDTLTANNTLRQEILKQLKAEYGDTYGESNVMITAIHTHATPGGVTTNSLYNVTTSGFHPETFKAYVGGAMEAIHKAHADMAPGNITVSRSQLTGVGVNRSMEAFQLNKPELKNKLVNGTDPTNTTMRFERNGKTTAVLNWYAVHPTSLTTKNTLISSDNKGYAEYLLEHDDHGVDYYTGEGDGFVAAFANANTGDNSPNTQLQPGKGPTDDQYQNFKIQGEKQANEVRKQLQSAGTPVGTGLDSRITYVNMAAQVVSPEFTGTGKSETTCDASLGQSFASGSEEDGGGGLSIFGEGLGPNPLMFGVSRAVYNISPQLKSCQYPKENLMAVSVADAVQKEIPVQMMRFGDYYVLGMPGEFTAAVGQVYREEAAKVFGVSEDKIIVQGYTNAYNHYVTTPEEYDSQQYEGGATVFGRYTMGAFQQQINTVGRSLKAGTDLPLGDLPVVPATSDSWAGKVLYDLPGVGRNFGDQTVAPLQVATAGVHVSAEFVGAHPNNNLKHGSSYMEVQRWDGEKWVYVAADNDPNTRFEWKRRLAAQSRVTVSWDVPTDAEPGRYRLVYNGDWKNGLGKITPFTGVSSEFTVM